MQYFHFDQAHDFLKSPIKKHVCKEQVISNKNIQTDKKNMFGKNR